MEKVYEVKRTEYGTMELLELFAGGSWIIVDPSRSIEQQIAAAIKEQVYRPGQDI